MLFLTLRRQLVLLCLTAISTACGGALPDPDPAGTSGPDRPAGPGGPTPPARPSGPTCSGTAGVHCRVTGGGGVVEFRDWQAVPSSWSLGTGQFVRMEAHITVRGESLLAARIDLRPMGDNERDLLDDGLWGDLYAGDDVYAIDFPPSWPPVGPHIIPLSVRTESGTWAGPSISFTVVDNVPVTMTFDSLAAAPNPYTMGGGAPIRFTAELRLMGDIYTEWVRIDLSPLGGGVTDLVDDGSMGDNAFDGIWELTVPAVMGMSPQVLTFDVEAQATGAAAPMPVIATSTVDVTLQ